VLFRSVEGPPPGPGPVTIRVANAAWGPHAGSYAQDVRRAGETQRWSLEVETTRVNEPVKLSWDRFPAGTRATLQVEGDPVARPLTRDGSVEFTAARPGVRRVTVIAGPEKGV